MENTRVKKRANLSDDDSNSFAILFTLMNSENPMSLSEMAKEINLPANLVFYHIKNLKEKYLIVENEDKTYVCQPILQKDNSEDLDALMMIIVKLIARGLVIDNPTEQTLSKAVVENLQAYLKIFELVVYEK